MDNCPINRKLSFLIYNYLRHRSVTSIFTHEKITVIRDNAIASVAIRDFNLISKINISIFKQLNTLSIW